MNKHVVNISDAFNAGWKNFKDNAVLWIVAQVFIGACMASLCYVELNGVEQIKGSLSLDPNMMLMGMVSLVGLISWVKTVALFIFGVGLVTIALKFARGKKAEFMDLFDHSHKIFVLLLAAIFSMIIVSTGFYLLIIPGIYFSLALSMAAFLVIDKDQGPIECLKNSLDITRGNLWQLLGVKILAILLNVIVFVVLGMIYKNLAPIGLLVTIPVTLGAYANIYRRLIGEKR